MAEKKHKVPVRSRRRRWPFVLLAVLAVAVIGGGWWYLTTPRWRPTVTLGNVGGPVESLAFSSDGRLLAVAHGVDRSGLLLAAQLRQLRKSAPVVQPAQPRVSAGITLWDVAQRRELGSHDDSQAGRVAFLDGDRALAMEASLNLIRLFSVETLEPISTVAIGVASPAFSLGGSLLATAEMGVILPTNNESDGGKPRTIRTIVIHEARTGSVRNKFADSGEVRSLWLSPDGKTLVTAGDSLRTWDVERGVETASRSVSISKSERAYFSPDGKTLAIQGEKQIRLWDVAGGEERTTLPAPGGIRWVEFSPDSRLLAGDFVGFPVKVWDVQAGTEPAPEINDDMSLCQCAAFSADGRLVVFGGSRSYTPWWANIALVQKFIQVQPTTTGSIGVWDLSAPGAKPYRARLPGRVTKLAFSPAGDVLAVGTQSGDVTLWDVPWQYRR